MHLLNLYNHKKLLKHVNSLYDDMEKLETVGLNRKILFINKRTKVLNMNFDY